MSLYVSNPTKQHVVFFYREPVDKLLASVEIASGAQAEIGHAWTAEQKERVIAQLERNGAILLWGTTMDGNDASYWYDVDYVVLGSHQTLAAVVINGSNNPQSPLYYNQPGINTLQAAEQQFMNSAMAFGIALPPVTVMATPFTTYVTQNPNNYAAGVYNGLAVTFTPQNGFKSITFNITVTDIVNGS